MRNVCIPVLVYTLVVVLGFHNGAWSQHDHEHHDHGHHHVHEVKTPEGPSPFDLTRQYLLRKELNNQDGSKISADKLEEVVSILLDRVNCTGRLQGDASCQKCAESITSQLFTIIHEEEQNGIDEEQFEKVAVVLFRILVTANLQHQCKNVINNSTGMSENVNIVLNTGGTAEVLTKDELERLLYIVKSYYTPQTKAQCFDAKSLFDDVVNDVDAGASKSELYGIASLVVVKLLQGDCIGKAEEVGPVTFLDAVIDRYSTDSYLGEMELDNLMFNISIGDHTGHDHGHGVHSSHGGHDHHHRRRRTTFRRRRQEVGHEHYEHDHAHSGHDHSHGVHGSHIKGADTANADNSLLFNKCFSAHELLDLHGFNHTVGVPKQEFSLLCPSLIQQIESRACQSSSHGVDDGTVEASLEVWLYGMLSVIIISCCSLMGGLVLPWMTKELYDKIVHTLVAMAVAVMSGDALIHLIPMAVGLHLHEHGGHDHAHDHGPMSPEFEYVWKCTAAMVTIYGFFLFETLTGFITGHVHSHGAPNDSPPGRTKDPEALCISYPLTVVHGNENNSHVNMLMDRQDKSEQSENHAYESGFAPEEITSDEVGPNGPNNIHVSGTRRLEPMKCEELEKKPEVSPCLRHGPLPIMVVLGDGLHNFGDGLAIGAAYLAGLGPGVSTSLAVFCHELPHELGDLAILLKSGVSMKWALFLNFLSALTCVMGLVVGILIGVTLQARQWIFAVTAGTFLYVALADMLPHITRVRETSSPVVIFLLVNIGFLVGIGVILIIALYEDAIVVKI